MIISRITSEAVPIRKGVITILITKWIGNQLYGCTGWRVSDDSDHQILISPSSFLAEWYTLHRHPYGPYVTDGGEILIPLPTAIPKCMYDQYRISILPKYSF